MELVVVLLEMVPLFFGVHLLHLLTQRDVLFSEDLKAFEEPLEPVEHRDASLFPKHRRDLLFVVLPVAAFLLVVLIRTVLRIAHSCPLRTLARQKLGIRVDVLLHVQGRRLH